MITFIDFMKPRFRDVALVATSFEIASSLPTQFRPISMANASQMLGGDIGSCYWDTQVACCAVPAGTMIGDCSATKCEGGACGITMSVALGAIRSAPEK